MDAAAGQLWIDFFDHGRKEPGARWLRRARPGEVVGALGPPSHGPNTAAQMILAGDETGLPGIARLLEAVPEETCGLALISVAGPPYSRRSRFYIGQYRTIDGYCRVL